MATFAMYPQGPAGPWPQETQDQMQKLANFQQLLLEAARKVDPGATLVNVSNTGGAYGQKSLVVNGKTMPITTTHLTDFETHGLTPDQIVGSYALGNPLLLTPEQRAKVQGSQLAALESAKASAHNEGGPEQVQSTIDQLKAFWATPEGQGPQPAPPRIAGENLGIGGNSPFGIDYPTPVPSPSVAPPTGGDFPIRPLQPITRTVPATGVPSIVPSLRTAVPPPVVAASPQPGTVPIARWKIEGPGQRENALALQQTQPVRQPNLNYQQNLDRFRQNRWGRGGR